MIDEPDRRCHGMDDRIRDMRPAIGKHMTVFVEGERAELDTRRRCLLVEGEQQEVRSWW